MTPQAQSKADVVPPVQLVQTQSKGTNAALKAHATRQMYADLARRYSGKVDAVRTQIAGMSALDARAILSAAYKVTFGSSQSVASVAYRDLMAKPCKAGDLVPVRIAGQVVRLAFAGRCKAVRAVLGYGYVMTDDGTVQVRVLAS